MKLSSPRIASLEPARLHRGARAVDSQLFIPANDDFRKIKSLCKQSDNWRPGKKSRKRFKRSEGHVNVLLFQRFESPYDALNRLSTSKDTELNLVTTTYDAHDRVLTVKDG